MVNAICIKYGTTYGPEYVNRLYHGLTRNVVGDLRFFCMTEDRSGIDRSINILSLPDEPFHPRMTKAMETAQKRGRLRKVSMFRPGLVPDLDGPLMVFDIDVVITGNIDELNSYGPGKVCMRREWGATAENHALGHGSVMRFDPALHPYLYEDMARDPEAAVARGRGSEQTYTSRSAEMYGDFTPFPDAWIVSFKYDCRPMRPLNLVLPPHKPRDARVVCFHGAPKMEEAVAGFRSDPLHSTRPCRWLKEAWIG